jgi:hypothetical protein
VGAAWPTEQNENVLRVASAFSSLFSICRSEHEKNGEARRKIRRDRAPSGKNDFTPEFSTVHSTSQSR